jgi:phytol kinase
MFDLKNTLLLSAAFLGLFGVAELLYRRFGVQAEYTRKLVHVGTGLLTLLFPLLLHSHWNVLLLCASFAGILLLSLRYHFLPSVNAIRRTSHGSICYPVAVYLAFLVYEMTRERGVSALHPLLFFYLPILTMALCDPAAALVGRRWPVWHFRVGSGRKSLMGTAAFWGVSVVLTTALMLGFQADTATWGFLALTAGSVATVTCLTEAFTPNGLDNVSIPIAALLCLWAINGAMLQFF